MDTAYVNLWNNRVGAVAWNAERGQSETGAKRCN